MTIGEYVDGIHAESAGFRLPVERVTIRGRSSVEVRWSEGGLAYQHVEPIPNIEQDVHTPVVDVCRRAAERLRTFGLRSF